MKSRITIVYALLVLVFASCKKEDKADTEVENKPVGKEYFSVEMDIVAESQDDFTVYYTEDNTNAFVGGQAVWKGVNGNGTDEKIVFDLPEEVIPTNIRLDFGIKPDRKPVTLKNLKFTFYDKTFEIKGSDFVKFFVKNDQIITEVDNAAGTVKFIKAPTSTVGTFFDPGQELLDQIAKMTK